MCSAATRPSVKVGEVLLVLGALHLANLAIFRRIRRRPAAAAAGQARRAPHQEPLRRSLPPEPVARDHQDVH
jgi:hypothetical protein